MRDIFDPAFRVLHRMHQSVDLLPDRFRALDDALGAFLAAVSELPGASRAAGTADDSGDGAGRRGPPAPTPPSGDRQPWAR